MTWKRLLYGLSIGKRILTETQVKNPEVIFSLKIKKLPYPSLIFNKTNVLQVSSKRHLGVPLDVKLAFDQHINNALKKLIKQ